MALSEKAVGLWALPMPSGGEPIAIQPSNYVVGSGAFSPDSKWVTYVSNESGERQVYVQSWPDRRLKRQISATGGIQPQWRSDGKELFYISRDGTLMAASIVLAPGRIESQSPVSLFNPGLEHVRPAQQLCGRPRRTALPHDEAGCRPKERSDYDHPELARTGQAMTSCDERLGLTLGACGALGRRAHCVRTDPLAAAPSAARRSTASVLLLSSLLHSWRLAKRGGHHRVPVGVGESYAITESTHRHRAGHLLRKAGSRDR